MNHSSEYKFTDRQRQSVFTKKGILDCVYLLNEPVNYLCKLKDTKLTLDRILI